MIYGIGINDADYPVEIKIGQLRSTCKFYRKWFAMLTRCYNKNEIRKHPSYAECSVCESWLLFSNFKQWMEQQDWEGKDLDKDLLVKGNKVYSPETCCFISREINTFMIDRGAGRGDYLLGVTFVKKKKLYRARCNNPFTKSAENLGLGKSEIEPHLRWKKRKHELACIYADMQSDERIANALRIRYA